MGRGWWWDGRPSRRARGQVMVTRATDLSREDATASGPLVVYGPALHNLAHILLGHIQFVSNRKYG
jgi:hypothetical protein